MFLRSLMVVVMLLMLGYTAARHVASAAPAAATPAILDVSTPVGSSKVTPSGTYLLLPATVVRIRLVAPYPSELVVNLNGTFIDKRTTRLPEAQVGSGYYMVDKVDVGHQPATWDITIYAPASFGTLASYYIDLADRSIDPAMTGTAKLSAKTGIKLVGPPAAPNPIAIEMPRKQYPQCGQDAFVHDNTTAFSAIKPDATVQKVRNDSGVALKVGHADELGQETQFFQIGPGEVNEGAHYTGKGFTGLRVRGRWVACVANERDVPPPNAAISIFWY